MGQYGGNTTMLQARRNGAIAYFLCNKKRFQHQIRVQHKKLNRIVYASPKNIFSQKGCFIR
jgi:hypothetical protein